MTSMTAKQIKEASDAGNSDFEVLQMAIDSGLEYPDAVWRVSQALRMDDEQRQEMEDKHASCC